MSDMSERIARAIYEASPRNKPWHALTAFKRNAYMREARDVLSVLHEPSISMLIAGVKAMRNPDLDVTEKELALGWRAMISKAMEG